MRLAGRGAARRARPHLRLHFEQVVSTGQRREWKDDVVVSGTALRELSGIKRARLCRDDAVTGINERRLQLHRDDRIFPIRPLVNPQECGEPTGAVEFTLPAWHDGQNR